MTELKIFQEYALNLVKFAAFRQQIQTRMAEEDGGGGPDAKRRRAFTRRETLEKLKELEGNVTAAVGENDSLIHHCEQSPILYVFCRCHGV